MSRSEAGYTVDAETSSCSLSCCRSPVSVAHRAVQTFPPPFWPSSHRLPSLNSTLILPSTARQINLILERRSSPPAKRSPKHAGSLKVPNTCVLSRHISTTDFSSPARFSLRCWSSCPRRFWVGSQRLDLTEGIAFRPQTLRVPARTTRSIGCRKSEGPVYCPP